MLRAGGISWEGFTFQHGFRILRPRYEPVPLSPLPGTGSAAATAGMKSEPGSTPVKVQHQPHVLCFSSLHDRASSPWLAELQGLLCCPTFAFCHSCSFTPQQWWSMKKVTE